MTSLLKEQIQEDMKVAMRAKDKQRLGTIRLIQAAIKQREVDERIVLNDEQVISILEKMIKQRRESLVHYQQANRQDLVDQELFEVEVIQHYMPQPLTKVELELLISTAISESGATSGKDMGLVMKHLKPQIQGRADMKQVSTLIKQKLG